MPVSPKIGAGHFDRAGGRRIHAEDFARIVGAVGERKYTMANEETVYNMIRRFTADWRGGRWSM